MSLDEYKRKRVFTRTPEPPATVREGAGNRFYIQRHSARRLHYDLRLEMDGVLKSWALPNGPTLDPAQKRLAVLVEDHPLDYGSFEGDIPAGNYGAGKVILWDRGIYEWLTQRSPADQWKAGDLKIQFHGQKLLGEFALVRTNRSGGKDWLLIKKKDFAVRPGWSPEEDIRSVLPGADPSSIEGAVEAEMPSKIEPMLATLGRVPPSGADWLFEVKWDGYRAICFIQEGAVRMVSRRGTIMDKQFPEVAEALPASIRTKTAIVDGEVVALDENGIPSFQLLQNRTGIHKSIKGGKPHALNFFAFDLLYLDGFDLRKAALIDRRQLLQTIVLPGEIVRYSDHFAGKGAELMQAVRGKGMEGIIAKHASSRYESRRSPEWIKIKVTNQQDFVICGFIPGEREYFGALALGYYRDEKLVYAGNAGSGFTQETLKEVLDKMKPLITREPVLSDVPKEIGEVTWVKPELVCVVKFNSWTDDLRLRAPVFQGLRLDSVPQDTVRENAEAFEPSSEADAAADSSVETRHASSLHSANAKLEAENLLPADAAALTLIVNGHPLNFTNLKKILYPDDGYAKRDVINFYAAVAELLIPHLQGRPLSLKRYPNGITADFFFQKEIPSSFPDWLHTEDVPTDETSTTRMVIADDKAALLYLANLGCIDQNPWMSRWGSLEHPDFVLIDLDPYHCGYDRIVEAAQLVREKLERIGLAGYPKTTGGNGLHIYLPLEPRYTYSQSRALAEILARWLASERPDLFTTPRAVASREKGKVYFDWMQNAEGKTISAPYVLRAHPGAPVATPLAWTEVRPGLKPQQFHMGNILRRFERVGDLFAGVLKKPQPIEESLEKMQALIGR